MKTLQISLLSLLMLLMSHLDIVGQEHGHKCCSKDHYVCSRYQSKLLKFSNVKENPNPKEVVTKSSCGYTAISQLASLSAPDLFNWLIGTTDVDCVYHPLVAYNPTYSSQVFSDANVTYITTNAINFLNGYDGQNNNGVRGIFRYLALAEFQKVSGNIS